MNPTQSWLGRFLRGDAAHRNALALGLLRVAVGALFLVFAQYKVFGSEFTHGGFESWINRFIEQGAYPFMLPVLKQFVLPHATAIAYLVACGESCIGLALISGLLVRAASVLFYLHDDFAFFVELSW
jgi:uncharacterized membrane protein YphA (DoxX/SURF4 family)